MRARFTAHVRHDFAFLHRSHRPTAATPFVPEAGTPTVTWTKLVIHSHELTDNPDKSYVDFTAYGTEEGVEKVLRGGSWDSPEWYCRSAQRWSALPNSRSRNIGFRFCIRDADRHRMPPTLPPTVDGGAVTH